MYLGEIKMYKVAVFSVPSILIMLFQSFLFRVLVNFFSSCFCSIKRIEGKTGNDFVNFPSHDIRTPTLYVYVYIGV
jgi:hypothetical protein